MKFQFPFKECRCVEDNTSEVTMRYYIGDIHFGHKKVLDFDSRPFKDVEEMDREIIWRWNHTVGAEDEVYIVGDFAYRNERPAEWYLAQLQGHKYLIIGNHDGNLLKNEKAMSYIEGVDKMMFVADEGRKVCICHFPLAEWNGFYKGALHVYGHSHNRQDTTWEIMKSRDRAYNAGCMLHDYRPVTLSELISHSVK